MKYTQFIATGIAAVVIAAAPLIGAGGDNSFVTKAAAGGEAELQMAQLAQTKASSQAVKDLANTLLADHTKAKR